MKNFKTLMLVTLISISAYAQQFEVSGVVSSFADKKPLPGVNVIVKGTTNGTQTDFDGNYKLMAEKGDSLVFSYIGFKSEHISIGEARIYDVLMEEDDSVLNEVVVSAFGIRAKAGIAGSTKSITIRGTSSVSALRGKVSGVSIRQSNFLPKAGQLTAGEIEDVEKWEEWLKSSKMNNWIQKNWEFNLEQKVDVHVKDELNNPVVNAEVTLYHENASVLMRTKTDAYGKTVLFLPESNRQSYYRIQANIGRDVVGKKITSTTEMVQLTTSSIEYDNDIDVMFTVDATGSMGDEINYLKSELQNIISRIDSSIINKRIGFTFYRDHGDEYVVKDFDFTASINDAKTFLNNQYANGGGDYEEAVELALKYSMEKSWNKRAKARLLFLILDAPPHFTQENVEIIKKQIAIAQQKGIKIIPVVASGANKTLEFLMRSFSVSTNGTYVFLTDDSGIGYDHLEPTTEHYTVEKLNDLIVRLIEKFAGVSHQEGS